MKISEVTNAFEVGKFAINSDFLKSKKYKKNPKKILLQSNLINLSYIKDKEIISKKNSHVYFFCANDKIVKIGASETSIKDNMSYYVERAIAGGFSPTRFMCHMLIYAHLKLQNEIKIHAITYQNIDVEIKDLDSVSPQNVGLSSKDLEQICIKQYYNKCNNYPEWNLQEQSKEYPEKIFELMNSYREFRKKKKHSLHNNNEELISHFRRCENYNLM
tara:strand:- start:1086 stop:1736 length:651 start_codon:yes stop_codon:yes gene_type:complete